MTKDRDKGNKNKDKRITIRCNAAEYEKIKANSNIADISISAYVRKQVLEQHRDIAKDRDIMTRSKEINIKDKRFTQRFTLRWNEAEFEEIKANAEIAHISITAYIRKRVLGLKLRAKIEMKMIAELSRLGSILRRIHTDSQGAYSELTKNMMNEIRDFIKVLSNAYTRATETHKPE